MAPGHRREDQCVDLVEVAGERVIGGTTGEARAAEMLNPRRTHVDDAADCVVRQFLVGLASGRRF